MNLKERIKGIEKLSPSQKKVARYIIDNPDQVAMLTAKRVGVNSETSETTVIRLCYALGYSGYNELQKEIRSSLLRREKTLHEFQDVSYHPSLGKGFIEAVVKEENKYREMNEWDDALIEEIVEAINSHKQITVIGLRASFAAAHWLSLTLNILRGNTLIYQSQVGDPNLLLANINSDSLIIAFSFPKYTRETLNFVKAAKKRGATVIGFSDHELSPLFYLSDIFLKVISPKPTLTKGMSILFSLLNVIISGVIRRNESEVEKRMQAYNQSGEDLQLFSKSEGRKEF